MPTNDYLPYLQHHGILGMKWGVRRYQNSDGSLTSAGRRRYKYKILKAGTKLNSVSAYINSTDYLNDRSKNKRWLYAYKAKNKWDRKVYEGPFSVYKMRQEEAFIYRHKFEVVKDLKMPTQKERINTFIDLYTNNKKMVVSDLSRVAEIRKSEAKDLNGLKTKKDFKQAYALFNHAMELSSAFESTKKYAEIMSKRYDAMTDDNNRGVYNNAKTPTIIFNPKKALKIVEKAEKIPLHVVMSNYNYVGTRMNRLGKPVAL